MWINFVLKTCIVFRKLYLLKVKGATVDIFIYEDDENSVMSYFVVLVTALDIEC